MLVPIPDLPVRPGTHGAYVDVYELRDRVEADSASVQRKGRITEGHRTDSGDADVYRLGEHVLAVLSNSAGGAARPQEVVAPWSAISADDVDDAVGAAKRGHQSVKHIEFLRIIAADVLGSMIA